MPDRDDFPTLIVFRHAVSRQARLTGSFSVPTVRSCLSASISLSIKAFFDILS